MAGEETRIKDAGAYRNTVRRFAEAGVVLPTIAQLADPSTIPEEIIARLRAIDPDAPHPLNLFRVHWFNAADRRERAEVPGYVVLPESVTGVPARIAVALGGRFPMITAHKVLAAFGCLVPRLVSGEFDPTRHKAIWPSTGNYCRGGVAISRILGCRGVAVLPEGMSAERFEWLARWVADPADVIRTPGSESNVKEIYDACHALARSPENVIFNQFAEFGNHLVHYACTGRALEAIFADMGGEPAGLSLRAFVSATGSAGTIAAGDYLKDRFGSATVAVEALECPTLLYNGFGEHNIQGIGDKHVPFIHNVMATDAVAAVSDAVSDSLFTLFAEPVGRAYLQERRGVPGPVVEALGGLGLSGIANVIAAIKAARYYRMGPDDVIVTVATDHAGLYGSELKLALARRFAGRFDAVSAGETFGRAILGASVDHFLELSRVHKDRIFNLGYFTWVEQQGVSLADFERRRDPGFWRGLRASLTTWDAAIGRFNEAVAAARIS